MSENQFLSNLPPPLAAGAAAATNGDVQPGHATWHAVSDGPLGRAGNGGVRSALSTDGGGGATREGAHEATGAGDARGSAGGGIGLGFVHVVVVGSGLRNSCLPCTYHMRDTFR